MTKNQKISKTKEERLKFEEKLRMYKFFKAGNFYEDNIGNLEVVQADNTIITTLFKYPSYTLLLTERSRGEVPNNIFLVS